MVASKKRFVLDIKLICFNKNKRQIYQFIQTVYFCLEFVYLQMRFKIKLWEGIR